MSISDETERLEADQVALVREVNAMTRAELGQELVTCWQREEQIQQELRTVQRRREAIERRARCAHQAPAVDDSDKRQVLRVPDYIVERRKKEQSFHPGRAETGTLEQPKLRFA